ncbi:MAG: aldo/keto reductase [Salinicola sp.]|nr:aldo/keto reductase [Salinicola sp.]
MAQVALAWLIGNTRTESLLLGASRPTQLQANIAALEVTLFGGHAVSRWARR